MLFIGCGDGCIYCVDMAKFPLRMKDNDLLVSKLYCDPEIKGSPSLLSGTNMMDTDHTLTVSVSIVMICSNFKQSSLIVESLKEVQQFGCVSSQLK